MLLMYNPVPTVCCCSQQTQKQGQTCHPKLRSANKCRVMASVRAVRVAAFVLLLGGRGGGAPRSDGVPTGLCGGTFRSGRGALGTGEGAGCH